MKNPKEKIIEIIKDVLAKALMGVSPKDLEENGKVYYMNDQNGTIFDWTMNEHASPLMCFYNDGIGAIKALVYEGGNVVVYYYDTTPEHKYLGEYQANISKDDALALTCFLYFNADEKDRFGKSLDDLEYVAPSAEDLAEFEKLCQPEE